MIRQPRFSPFLPGHPPPLPFPCSFFIFNGLVGGIRAKFLILLKAIRKFLVLSLIGLFRENSASVLRSSSTCLLPRVAVNGKKAALAALS